mgnify:CR=1 FL=1
MKGNFMKIAYISYSNIDEPTHLGINKKIRAQVEALNDLYGNTVLFTFNREGLISIERHEIKLIHKFKSIFSKRIEQRLFFVKAISRSIHALKPDIVYVRFSAAEPMFIRLLKKLNRIRATIVLEIPTYPYSQELSFYKRSIDNIYARKLKEYVDVIASTANKDCIFGIHNIFFTNGIDYESIPIIDYKNNCEEFVLIGVANLSTWHGFDRIIHGINEYMKSPKRKIEFRIVGNGPVLDELKLLVKDLELSDQVRFYGPKSGEDLFSIYRTSTIAIGSLGIYRNNLSSVSTLKNREYCALGIPFIYSGIDPDFPDSFRYALGISNDDTPVDIETLIEFSDSLIRGEEDFRTNMRQYAKDKLSWKRKMKDIFVRLTGEEAQ